MFLNTKDVILNMIEEAKEANIDQKGRIKAVFALAGVTASKLATAQALGVSEITKVIKGERNTAYIQLAIAKYLEIPGSVLFDNYKGQKSSEDYLF